MTLRRIRTVRVLLWLGAFMPFIYTVGRTVDEVGGIGPIEVIRGGGSLVALVLSYMVAPKPVRKMQAGIPEFGILLFLGIAAASTLWSYDSRATALKVVPLLFAYWCCFRLVTMYPTSSAVIRSLVTVAHTILIFGVVQFALVPGEVYSALPGDIARFHTVIPAIGPNLLGLIVGIAVAGILLRVGPEWTYRGLWVPLALMAVYAAMLLAGRSRIVTVLAILIVIVAVFVAMRRSPLASAFGWLTIGAALIGVFVLANTPAVINAVTEFALRDQDANSLRTLTGRTKIWDYAVLAWEQNPLIGYGYYAGHRLALPTMFAIFAGYSNLDNTWMESLVNVGLIGTLALAVYVVGGLLRTLGHDWGRSERWIAWGVAVAVVGLSFINPTVQDTNSNMIMFAVVVAACRREVVRPLQDSSPVRARAVSVPA